MPQIHKIWKVIWNLGPRGRIQDKILMLSWAFEFEGVNGENNLLKLKVTGYIMLKGRTYVKGP